VLAALILRWCARACVRMQHAALRRLLYAGGGADFRELLTPSAPSMVLLDDRSDTQWPPPPPSGGNSGEAGAIYPARVDLRRLQFDVRVGDGGAGEEGNSLTMDPTTHLGWALERFCKRLGAGAGGDGSSNDNGQCDSSTDDSDIARLERRQEKQTSAAGGVIRRVRVQLGSMEAQPQPPRLGDDESYSLSLDPARGEAAIKAATRCGDI
jgi:hypothetical protein